MPPLKTDEDTEKAIENICVDLGKAIYETVRVSQGYGTKENTVVRIWKDFAKKLIQLLHDTKDGDY